MLATDPLSPLPLNDQIKAGWNAKIGASKHIRVRPRFDHWSTTGDLVVTDDQITDSALSDIYESAGRYKGLCDWRPGSKTPGTFGMFEVDVQRK